ncbi:MAG TPA: hypothetical protein DIS76_06145, partial [Rhodospirillaceae bacterium]|nr:hypothetical protein [Rhodospirillaceae bacterium]
MTIGALVNRMKIGNQNMPGEGSIISDELLLEMESLSVEVGAEIMRYFRADISISHKNDGSPVTEADHAAEQIIVDALRQITPGIPIIAEEAYTIAADKGKPTPDVSGGRFWLIDALDGTREFIKHNEDFTVNIALIDNNEPALGVIYHPVSNTIYSGTSVGTAMRIGNDGQRQKITASLSDSSLRIVSSQSYGNEIQLAKYLAGRQIIEHRHRPSSIKFCEVAEGRADLYPRFGPSREWDTAAGHAIVYAAGG